MGGEGAGERAGSRLYIKLWCVCRHCSCEEQATKLDHCIARESSLIVSCQTRLALKSMKAQAVFQ